MDDLCTTCLCTGRNLQFLEDTEYYHLYLQIINENHQHARQARVCWECRAVLRRFQRFQWQARRCQMLLSEQGTLKCLLSQLPRLSTQVLENISYPPIEVKTEPTDEVSVEILYNIKVETDDTTEHCEPEIFVNNLELDKSGDQDQSRMETDEDDTSEHCEAETFDEHLESDGGEDEEQNQETVRNAELCALPEKSQYKYIKAFEHFNAWRLKKGLKSCSETVLLTYFTELASSRKPSTLWSVFSMLKATLNLKKNVHIEKYPNLMAFLKKSSSGHKPQKSKIFTAAEVARFLKEAPDSEYLAAKVALIIGISGGCRSNELTNLMTNDIERHSDTLLLIKLRDTKANIDRNFVVRDEYVKIIEKYQKLRPATTSMDRFFLGYRKGRCVNQPMGSNKIGGLPREIATFLGLAAAEQYTGHCFRRTSATLLSDSGADLSILKRLSGGKSHVQ